MSGGEDTATVTCLAKQGERGKGFEAVPGSIYHTCRLLEEENTRKQKAKNKRKVPETIIGIGSLSKPELEMTSPARGVGIGGRLA